MFVNDDKIIKLIKKLETTNIKCSKLLLNIILNTQNLQKII